MGREAKNPGLLLPTDVSQDREAEPCPLCQKLGQIDHLPPEDVVWQFPHSVAFLGPWQAYPGYCTLVSRQHARELYHLDNTVRQSYLEEMCLLAQAIDQAFRPRKINYEMLGNQVPHLHWHLFPRPHDDPEPRKAVWLALERAEHEASERRRLETGPEERGILAQKVRSALKTLSALT